MWLFHLCRAVKIRPFSPAFPLAESVAKAFGCLFFWNFWNFKEKASAVSYGTANLLSLLPLALAFPTNEQSRLNAFRSGGSVASLSEKFFPFWQEWPSLRTFPPAERLGKGGEGVGTQGGPHPKSALFLCLNKLIALPATPLMSNRSPRHQGQGGGGVGLACRAPQTRRAGRCA